MKPAIAIMVLLLSACGSKEGEQDKVAAVMAPPVMKEAVSYEMVSRNETADKNPEDLIMKRADVRFQVKNVEANTKNIEKLVSARRGLIARENLSTATEAISNEITIRVPASAFEALLDDLGKEAQFVDYKRVASQNVTEEYQDIQTRLRTKKEVRDRYVEILKTKAKTVEDILKAEAHIGELQEEIEAKEGRLQFLKTRVSMSEINLEIYQKVIYKETPALLETPYVAKVGEALGNGWGLITSFSLLMINTWPVLILVSTIYWAWRRRRQRLMAEESV